MFIQDTKIENVNFIGDSVNTQSPSLSHKLDKTGGSSGKNSIGPEDLKLDKQNLEVRPFEISKGEREQKERVSLNKEKHSLTLRGEQKKNNAFGLNNNDITLVPKKDYNMNENQEEDSGNYKVQEYFMVKEKLDNNKASTEVGRNINIRPFEFRNSVRGQRNSIDDENEEHKSLNSTLSLHLLPSGSI